MAGIQGVVPQPGQGKNHGGCRKQHYSKAAKFSCYGAPRGSPTKASWPANAAARWIPPVIRIVLPLLARNCRVDNPLLDLAEHARSITRKNAAYAAFFLRCAHRFFIISDIRLRAAGLM